MSDEQEPSTVNGGILPASSKVSSLAGMDLTEVEEKISSLSKSVQELQSSQKGLTQQLKVGNICSRLEGLENRQEEVIRLLSSLRCELAGISSGMARRDSLMLGSGLQSLRRDSLLVESRRSSFLGEAYMGKGGQVPVLEVEPWTPSTEVQQNIDRLLERQFLLSPWMKEKRLRNQLRLILKDHLEAGPQRRSTITKIVHDAHQLFPVWRGQIKEVLFQNWDEVQELNFSDAAQIIFGQFKKQRVPDEIESTLLYSEHMIEVGQYLKRKVFDRAVKAGKAPPLQASITNSKFWYEVRKKINEVLESNKVRRLSSSQPEGDSEGDDDSTYHSPASPQGSLQGDDDEEKREKSPRKIGRMSRDGGENCLLNNLQGLDCPKPEGRSAQEPEAGNNDSGVDANSS